MSTEAEPTDRPESCQECGCTSHHATFPCWKCDRCGLYTSRADDKDRRIAELESEVSALRSVIQRHGKAFPQAALERIAELEAELKKASDEWDDLNVRSGYTIHSLEKRIAELERVLALESSALVRVAVRAACKKHGCNGLDIRWAEAESLAGERVARVLLDLLGEEPTR